MLDAERIPLPPGLPAHLSVGKEGYDTLCALLDVATRERRQALASATFVKQFLKAAGNAPARQARTAERTRQSLLALYSDPDARRRIWRNVRHHESTDKAGGTPLPSLEHAALSRYDAALLTAEPDPERLANSDAFYVSELGSHDWRAPALAALPRLRDDFADWSSAPPARRTEIIAAAFATATLLDDARLLRWAADREDDIAREYAFLDKASAASGADEDTSATDGARGDLPARPTFLGERMEEGLLQRLKPTSDANGLVGVLNRLRPDRDTYVCLVDDDEPWTLRWLDRAADALRKAQRGRKLRVVFCADPDQLWRFWKNSPTSTSTPTTTSSIGLPRSPGTLPSCGAGAATCRITWASTKAIPRAGTLRRCWRATGCGHPAEAGRGDPAPREVRRVRKKRMACWLLRGDSDDKCQASRCAGARDRPVRAARVASVAQCHRQD